MGLPIPASSPQITVNGIAYTAAACLWNTPDGGNYIGGVYELKADGWNFVAAPNNIFVYLNDGEMAADVKSKGGSAAYCEWFKGQVNAAFAKLMSAAPVSTEPNTDNEAMAMLQAYLATRHIVMVNGVPQLQ